MKIIFTIIAALILSFALKAHASNKKEIVFSVVCKINDVHVLRTFQGKTENFTHIIDDDRTSYVKTDRTFKLEAVFYDQGYRKNISLEAWPINFSSPKDNPLLFYYNTREDIHTVVYLAHRKVVAFGETDKLYIGPDEITNHNSVELRKSGGVWYGNYTDIKNLRADKSVLTEMAGFSCSDEKGSLEKLYNEYYKNAVDSNKYIVR